jgi:hypothetical protein
MRLDSSGDRSPEVMRMKLYAEWFTVVGEEPSSVNPTMTQQAQEKENSDFQHEIVILQLWCFVREAFQASVFVREIWVDLLVAGLTLLKVW